MASKKIVIISILISLISHVFILYVSGFADWRGKVRKDDILTITFKEPTPDTDIKEEKKEIKPVHQADEGDGRTMKKEDTVELGSADAKYTPYLKKIKKRIEIIWKYPQAAFEQEEEGTAIIKFSISDRGDLLASGIIKSSGSNYLDQGALDVVRSAAPYAPFPREFHLSQLNIVARFEYKLVD